MLFQNQPENEATVINFYESITVTNRQESRDESADEALEPLLSTPSPPLPTSQGENRVYSAPSSQDTIETVLSSPLSNDDRILVYPGPLYDLPQLPGSTVVLPPTDIQDQSNEQESPPPVPLRTEDSKVLVQESSNRSPSAQNNTSTNIQSPPDPTYAEPQLPGRAPVQTSSTEEQAHSPPPVPPRTEESNDLLIESSCSPPSSHITVSIDVHQPPPPDPTYDEPQLPISTIKQPQKQVSASGESCDPVIPTASDDTSPPDTSPQPVANNDVKEFKNWEVCIIHYLLHYAPAISGVGYCTCHVVTFV